LRYTSSNASFVGVLDVGVGVANIFLSQSIGIDETNTFIL